MKSELTIDSGRVVGPPVLVNGQWDYCRKAEYTRKVSLERSLMGRPWLLKGPLSANETMPKVTLFMTRLKLIHDLKDINLEILSNVVY